MRATKMLKSLNWWNKKKEAPSNQPISLVSAISGSKEGSLNEYSDTWIFVSNWAVMELQRARERNDSPKRDAVQTAVLRGKIEVLKELLELPHPKDRRTRNAEQDE